ncbi:MAG TPA: hypothetical protein VI756_19005 [Blastocatellia bacterium]
MSSLILDLQQKSLDSGFPVTDLVRMALLCARKLGLEETRSWAEQELNGYDDVHPVPKYRVLRGQPAAYDAQRGWERVLTYNLDPGLLEALSTFKIDFPAGKIEADLRPGEAEFFAIRYQPGAEIKTSKALNRPGIPAVLITASQFQGILDAVRTRILEWSINLEEAGIYGEGMVFSPTEKQAARSLEDTRAPAV